MDFLKEKDTLKLIKFVYTKFPNAFFIQNEDRFKSKLKNKKDDGYYNGCYNGYYNVNKNKKVDTIFSFVDLDTRDIYDIDFFDERIIILNRKDKYRKI